MESLAEIQITAKFAYMETMIKEQLAEWAEKYNDTVYFQVDPIIFPRHFA